MLVKKVYTDDDEHGDPDLEDMDVGGEQQDQDDDGSEEDDEEEEGDDDDPLLYDIEQYVEMHRAAHGGEHDDDGAHAGAGAVAAAAAQAEAEAAVAAASALAGRRGAQGPHGNYVDSGGRRRGRVGPGRKRVRRTSSVAQLRYDDLEVLGLQDFMISHLAHPRSPHVAAQVQYDDVEVVEAGE